MKQSFPSLPKWIVSFLLVFSISFIFPPNLAKAENVIDNGPWLGVGLGFNHYVTADVEGLGKPWVFNWGMGDTYMANHTDHNRPDLDFPDRYVPMLYGCSISERNTFKTRVEEYNYEGPILIFNEPDNQTYAECTYKPADANGPAVDITTAVTVVEDIIAWRDTYYQNTGRYLDILIGGTFASPNTDTYGWGGWHSTHGGFWMDQFKTAWQAEHGANTWPNVEGIHFHVYSYYSYNGWDPNVRAQKIIDAMKNDIDATGGWEDWLESNPMAKGTKERIWVTEVGVHDTTETRTRVGTVMDAILPYLKSKTWIDRAAWYTHSATTQFYDSNDQTMLVDTVSGSKTALYTKFKNWCTTQGYCVQANEDYYTVFMNNWGNYPDWTAPTQFLYYPKYNLPLTSNDQAPGTFDLDKKLIISVQPEHGQAFATLEVDNQVIYYVPNHLYKGYDSFQYKIVNPDGTFISSTAQVAIMDFWLDYPDYLNNGTVPSYLQGGFLAPAAPAQPKAADTPSSGNYSANPAITVKYGSITGNLIKNTKTANFDCNIGAWCRWQRNTSSSYLIEDNGALSITAPATTGDYGSCWIQWVDGGIADGSTYRIKARYLSDFPLNKSFIQIQTLSNENYMSTTWWPTVGGGTYEKDVAISSPENGNFAVKFCSWGTNTPLPARATLEKLSVVKL